MKYAFEMGSGDIIFIPSFIKIGLVIQKLMGIHRYTDSIIILLFSFNFFRILERMRNEVVLPHRDTIWKFAWRNSTINPSKDGQCIGRTRSSGEEGDTYSVGSLRKS
jgi:hypothetical protein